MPRPARSSWAKKFPYASQHGSGGSPALHGDLLIFSGDGHYEAWVIALDKRTGNVKWKTERRKPFDQAYTTPLVISVNGRDQVVSVGAYRAAAYDAATGKEIWMVRYEEGFSNVPRPVFAHGLVFITTGFFQPAVLAVRPDGTGDVTSTHIAWSTTRGAPFTPSPIASATSCTSSAISACSPVSMRKPGKPHWQERLGGNHSASPVFADGRIYFLSEEGVATVIAPGKTFQKLAVNELDGATLASMAVADGVDLHPQPHASVPNRRATVACEAALECASIRKTTTPGCFHDPDSTTRERLRFAISASPIGAATLCGDARCHHGPTRK